MNVGFQLPANYAFSERNGIRQEACLKAQGLEAAGHKVTKINAWHPASAKNLDVLHFFYGGYALHGIDAARSAGTRKIVFSTTIDSNESNLKYRIAASLGRISARFSTVQGEFQRQCQQSDIVITRSKHEYERVVRGLGIPSSKVKIVHLPNEKPMDSPLPIPDEREGIFHLSTYGQSRKNIYRLIDAIGPTKIPLCIAGQCEAAEQERIRKHAREYHNITVRDQLTAEEKEKLFLHSRVFLLPSTHEGTGLAAMEAANHGCQVVVTQNGGPPDYFSEIGWLVNPTSTADIRNKTIAAYNSDKLSENINVFRKKFSMESVTQQLMDAYGI